MTVDSVAVAAFAAFGLASQAVLACFLAARRWRPRVAQRFGWLTYAFVGLGLPLGLWLLVRGESWMLCIGPLLMAAWALFGVVVDHWRPRQWRWPIVWNVFAPYLALYFLGQMFMWWPLWYVLRAAWVVYLVLFVANTTLNLREHLDRR